MVNKTFFQYEYYETMRGFPVKAEVYVFQQRSLWSHFVAAAKHAVTIGSACQNDCLFLQFSVIFS